jgi:hypothetical protein
VLVSVAGLLLDEGDGVVAPVAEWVEVVGRVVAVIEAETVGLGWVSWCVDRSGRGVGYVLQRL